MSLRGTSDMYDPRNHAQAAWLRGFRWAVLGSIKNDRRGSCCAPGVALNDAAQRPDDGLQPTS